MTPTLTDAPDGPLVSVVTPSYNMGRFLEETIQSVLSQDYPHIEYLVMDGGSTDRTLEILRKYEGRLFYESGPDGGQCDAVNRGFLRSRGQIFAFLNADDTYLPGAVGTAVRRLLANPDCAGVYGEGYLTNEDGGVICRYPTKTLGAELLKADCPICQPSVFLWRDAFAEAGMLDTGIRNGLDYDLWIRIVKRRPLLKVDDYLATSRMHPGARTLAERRGVYRSNIAILKRHYGYAPFPVIYAYCCSLLDKRDGFFEPVPPSLAKYLSSLACGSYHNLRHLARYWREWLAAGVDAWRRRVWRRPARRP
jgi:glycosyltransferase involved in cell wall biosynthesis